MTLAPEHLAPIKIACDAGAFEASMAELARLLVDAPDGFVEGILALPNGVCDLVSLDSNGSGTAGADKLTITLQPTEFMNRLMAAARAGDFDLSVFDHVPTSVGCVEPSNRDREPGELQGPSGSRPQPSLIERLCSSLAFHLVESEMTLSHSEGEIEDWRAECDQARALIKEAEFDIDVLYPILDRPTSEDPT